MKFTARIGNSDKPPDSKSAEERDVPCGILNDHGYIHNAWLYRTREDPWNEGLDFSALQGSCRPSTCFQNRLSDVEIPNNDLVGVNGCVHFGKRQQSRISQFEGSGERC